MVRLLSTETVRIYFSGHFGVSAKVVEKYGAFNVSLVADLPLFIDPFLLFNSRKKQYRGLHDGMIKYLIFLRDKSVAREVTPELREAWYRFAEIKQTWLGFSATGNRGSGLGQGFARALDENLYKMFGDFGQESVTKGSHLEKLCLIQSGVGRDNISDFTTNLILEFLVEYTQAFATTYISAGQRRRVSIRRLRFNYDTESWEGGEYDLPWYAGDYVLLTPRAMLTKDDTWINRTDLVREFHSIPDAIPNVELRGQINNYFRKMLPRRAKKKDEDRAAVETILQFPELIDYFIRYKEERGDQATNISAGKVESSKRLYVDQFRVLASLLEKHTGFYGIEGATYEEAHARVAFLKDVIENKGGQRIFYIEGKPVEREADLHILYRLTWFATSSDVSREVNDGRGPVDFKVSRGGLDKTVVEFKLASNGSLKRNLERQVEVYKKASDAKRSIKVILYFTKEQLRRVMAVLKKLKLEGSGDVVLINARRDDKPSGSKA
jgi:hypothetical protein